MKRSTCVFFSGAILSGLQIIVYTANSNAQSNQQILNETNDLIRQAPGTMEQIRGQEQRDISRLSCSQLLEEAQELNRQGDYWSAQVNVPHYAARASGAYASSERRSVEYNRRCR